MQRILTRKNLIVFFRAWSTIKLEVKGLTYKSKKKVKSKSLIKCANLAPNPRNMSKIITVMAEKIDRKM